MENAKRPLEDSVGASSSARIFDAEAFGRSMREVGVDIIEGESTDFVSRWLHADQGEADLVIWTDTRHRVIKIQVCIFGQIVEWNPIHGTRTGYVFEREVALATSTNESSEIIRYDRDVQLHDVRQAIEILSYCPDLKDELRSTLIFNLRESPKMHKRTRERALKEWAPKIDEIVSDQSPSFWKRLKSWVLGE